jgi:hypothetical protein
MNVPMPASSTREFVEVLQDLRVLREGSDFRKKVFYWYSTHKAVMSVGYTVVLAGMTAFIASMHGFPT